MVQLTIDTNSDPVSELEEALHILQTAIARRSSDSPPARNPAPVSPSSTVSPPEDESSLDTPFLKITVKDVVQPDVAESQNPKMPTLNQLLSDDSLSEEEITTLFKETQRLEAESRPSKSSSEKSPTEDSADAFIEIVEFDEEK